MNIASINEGTFEVHEENISDIEKSEEIPEKLLNCSYCDGFADMGIIDDPFSKRLIEDGVRIRGQDPQTFKTPFCAKCYQESISAYEDLKRRRSNPIEKLRDLSPEDCCQETSLRLFTTKNKRFDMSTCSNCGTAWYREKGKNEWFREKGGLDDLLMSCSGAINKRVRFAKYKINDLEKIKESDQKLKLHYGEIFKEIQEVLSYGK